MVLRHAESCDEPSCHHPEKRSSRPALFQRLRLDDTQQNELALGGRVFVEGCAMRGSDITYSGKVGFDVLSNEYKMTDYQFSRPYISPQLDKQLDDRQRTALLTPKVWIVRKRRNIPFWARTARR